MDFAVDFINALNATETAAARTHRQPYHFMTTTLCNVVNPGYEYILDYGALSALPSRDSIQAMRDSICQLTGVVQAQQEATMEALDALRTNVDQLQESLNAETHVQVGAAAEKADLPIPFRSTQECEVFLQDDLNALALSAAFTHSPAVLKQKAKIDKKSTTAFPVHAIMEFLFGTNFSWQTEQEFDAQTQEFIVGRSRWIMGPQWEGKSKEKIMRKVGKYISYVSCTKVRRSGRKIIAKKVVDV